MAVSFTVLVTFAGKLSAVFPVQVEISTCQDKFLKLVDCPVNSDVIMLHSTSHKLFVRISNPVQF